MIKDRPTFSSYALVYTFLSGYQKNVLHHKKDDAPFYED